ncbi:hypothetical protein ANCCAN_07374 [Ancylostoma caninum]|uniref:Protein BCCIP homolog n=1 Tax=Ancylostoma caninum TaxID=29170 RepID=A0A368GSN6_ANCCA|nr:hypothetical protein ANCCAN_07374 [Ancylostoma caninum]
MADSIVSAGLLKVKKHPSVKKSKKLKRKLVTEEEGSVASSAPTIRNKVLRPMKKKKKKSKKLKKEHLAVETAGNNGGPSHNDSDENGEPSEDADDTSGDGETSDLFADGTGQQLDFDIEAFPMEADDRDGIVNMLTQVFLRADIDLPGLADAVIAQSPFGIVIGPAEDQSDEDSENVVYGVVTIARLRSAKGEPSKYAKDIMDFLEKKSQKFALPDFRTAFETLKTKRTGLFINERMLNFPKQIVPPSFNSLRSDYESLQKQYQRIVYVHKLRIADSEPGSAVAENGNEDEALIQIEEGEAHFFDYPVHTEIESCSKFHTLVKDGKSFKPYRRVVIMDNKRFKAFLDHVSTSF